MLIVGASQVGNVMRKQIIRNSHLGRSFKGFVETAESRPTEEAVGVFGGRTWRRPTGSSGNILSMRSSLPTAAPLPAVIELVEMARELDVEVLVIPGFYDELTHEAPIEYLGDFPVVSLHRRHGKVVAQLFKRIFDFAVSAALLVALLPTLLVIALAIKLDSPGPVFYTSDRVGKKGRVFHCFKFRTMVVNAEQLKHSLSGQE